MSDLNAKNKKKLLKSKPLPIDFGTIDKSNVETSDFISRLQSSGFISKNKSYLENYINADLSIAFSHIKNTYKEYVLNGGWAEDKYETVLYAIIDNNEMLVPRAFMKYGTMYDKGEITQTSVPEEEEYTDDELIAYLKSMEG